MITVCDWAKLSIGQLSTPSSLRSRSAGRRRGHIYYDCTLRKGQPALQCANRVSDHRRKCSSVTLS
jgi:hypothetical protein